MLDKPSTDVRERTETRDGMTIDWDVPITMDDGLVLRADVFRPIKQGRYPVILSCGPYGKWLAFQEGYPTAWDIMVREHPDVAAGSTNQYQAWEVVDPEKWVPDGYVCVRVDSRGAGRSPGYIDHFSPRETKDIYDCIEWAAQQPWSSGKIGMNGISYYAINQWQVAGLQPPHLSAICVWEGAGDWYRDKNHHGGILCTFQANWSDMQIKTVQHGLGTRGKRSRIHGGLVSGPEELSDTEMDANRSNLGGEIAANPLDNQYHRDHSADWDKIEVPLLSCGNWGGTGLHLRGNIEGFMRAASRAEMAGDARRPALDAVLHRLRHRAAEEVLRPFPERRGHRLGQAAAPATQYSSSGREVRAARRKRMAAQAHAMDQAASGAVFADACRSSRPRKAAQVSFDALGDGLQFTTAPLPQETEITGPVAAKLFVSSSTADADLFLVLQVYGPDGKEIVFHGALDPHTPIGQGWLRMSHRKLDKKLSLPYRPYHTHDEMQPLTPGEIYELDIEIWPTCLVIPAGSRIVLAVRGKDYVYKGESGGRLSNMKNEFTGCGPFLHDDPQDRPPDIFGGKTTLHAGPGQESYLLLPVIPPKR